MRGPGIPDSARTFRGSGFLAQLMLPSGYTRATGTASTSAVAAGEGRTHGTSSTSAVAASEGRSDGTSGPPSSDDHMGEVKLPTTNRQTHTIGHLIVTTLSGAHLRPSRPRRAILASCHGGRI
jgi:hypothetical protein